MKKEVWLRNEIATWRTEGLLDEASANAILARYPETSSKIGLAAILAGSFAAFLIGLGIISIFAANWTSLSNLQRAIIASTPLTICGAIACYAIIHKWKTKAFWEPIGILWFISCIAATCLVAQTYNMGGPLPDLVLLLAILTWPIPLICKSIGAMSLWLILPFVWMGCDLDASWNNNYKVSSFLTVLALLAASVPCYLIFVRKCTSRFGLYLGSLTTGLAYSVGVAAGIISYCMQGCTEEMSFIPFWICAAILAAIAFIFKLPHWPTIALNVSIFVSLFTPLMRYAFTYYIMALLLAVGAVVYGIKKSSLSSLNKGTFLLLWLILFKFFQSSIDFTVKGTVLIACGGLLAAMNIWLMRARKKGLEQ